LLTESKVLDHGTHKMIIPRNELSPGVYILSITADNFNKILRVSAQ
jgi:hypothetical protein